MHDDFIIEEGILVEYNGDSNEIIIPDTVRIIDRYVFLGRNITKVTMSDSVIEVREKAFHECEKLKSVKLSENLEKIGDCAFCGNAVKKIKIPSSVREIGWGAFCDYRTEKLEEVVFQKESKIEKVESRAFGMHPMLKRVSIPSRLKNAFSEDSFDKVCEITWIE